MRLWLALSAVVVVLGLLIVPPFISINRYKSRITQVVAASVGRPVRLSSVELRVLPRPSFVLTDLVVEEDPAYGAEPVLHASTVQASIRMLPLWFRGRLEISRISVDEASLNLVRTGKGWNLDPFFRTATRAGGNSRAVPYPYLEATNSRVNIKNGVEKLPYSLVNADLAFWEENPGQWRLRLRGQPARTDVSLDLADTGIVHLEASMRRASRLRQMPIHLDMDWRDAQLGQLSRLMLGSDEGWRGDLRGEVHVDGTAESAQVQTRLRATGVHRVEFAPASPIDFDATCAMVYHYTGRGVEKLLCDSPVGDGRARLTGDLPGRGETSHLTVELDRVPAQVALDTLRTVRNGLDPSLEAAGSISGRMSYSPAPPLAGPQPEKGAKRHAPPPGPLNGSITIANLRIRGNSLSHPVQVAKITLEPAPGEPAALASAVTLPMGGSAPLNVAARLSLDSYQVDVHGGASLARLRELARAADISGMSVLDRLNGQPATVDLTAEGPWVPPFSPLPVYGSSTGSPALTDGTSDRITGTVSLHAVSWKPDFLANPVEIPNAMLTMDDSGWNWDPVTFSYGPVKGTATLKLPSGCAAPEKCTPRFTVQFGSLEASALEAALLGAHKSGTLLSSLLARLKPASTTPGWPEMDGTVGVDTLILGPVTLNEASAALHIGIGETEISSFEAGLLGGKIHAQGSVTQDDKPGYKLKGRFEQVRAAELGRLLGMTWSGNPLEGSGEVEMAGFTDRDLAASAKGSLHFDWRRGSVANRGELEVPAALNRFERWTADAEIGNSAITLRDNQVRRGARKAAVEATAAFGEPPQVSFGGTQEARAAKR